MKRTVWVTQNHLCWTIVTDILILFACVRTADGDDCVDASIRLSPFNCIKFGDSCQVSYTSAMQSQWTRLVSVDGVPTSQLICNAQYHCNGERDKNWNRVIAEALFGALAMKSIPIRLEVVGTLPNGTVVTNQLESTRENWESVSQCWETYTTCVPSSYVASYCTLPFASEQSNLKGDTSPLPEWSGVFLMLAVLCCCCILSMGVIIFFNGWSMTSEWARQQIGVSSFNGLSAIQRRLLTEGQMKDSQETTEWNGSTLDTNYTSSSCEMEVEMKNL